jgi:hypothetical protein
MKTKTLHFLILSSFAFSGCSWTESFTVNNLSGNPIYVHYKTKPLSEGKSFGIIEHSPTFYKATNKGNIDWNNEIKVEDTNDKDDVVSVYLPPKTIMIFGRLRNDNYESTEQSFINSREFNLDFIEIEVNLEVIHISKNAFDKNFKKEKGYIKFEIQ